MKLINKFWMLLAGASLLASCELDTAPEGATVTEEQKQEIVDMNPDRIAADVANLAATMFKQYGVGSASSNYGIDFGYPSVCIANDYNGPDMVCANNDYNWYTPACDYTDRDPNYIVPYVEWTFFYDYLKAANDVLASIPAETENETLKAYRGQALGARAFVLFGLVQRFQFTYKGHEEAPSIPIVTDDMSADQAAVNPRAPLSVAYTQILEDLSEAIELLEGYQRPNKSTIDQQVAYGLRARVNLVMQNYAEAAEDAAKALAGYTPYTMSEVSKPTFQDGTHHAWIWGCIINEADITGSRFITWQSWLSSFSDGYGTGTRCYARCNVELYNKIPASDVRKGWWVDENLESPLLNGLSWPGYEGQPIGPLSIPEIKEPFYPYTNVKFGATDDEIGNTDNSGDWPLMRAEEMLLIQAEATGLAGNIQAGVQMLESFVKTYRNPEYKCVANNEEMFRNAVWFQRRVELWGEGFAFQDMMRMEKPLVRFNGSRKGESNFPDAYRFNIPANDEVFLCTIPQGEINSNDGISDEDNNQGIGRTPVMDQNPDLKDGVTD